MKDFWRNRRVLVTGHTGFKGAWLCLWLERLGAVVHGFALAPETTPALSDLLSSTPDSKRVILDLMDTVGVAHLLATVQPEIVIHLAAQALVRRSYTDPAATFAVNVTGTANVLAAVKANPGVKATVVVTTDKVYENDGQGRPFEETDRLGGEDPYSASKACAELVSRSFRTGLMQQGQALATARAGNVVGGGDWSADRLVPDVVRALAANRPLDLRYPDAVRPWQHVLEPLAGYLTLAQSLFEAPGLVPAALNFGPDPRSFAPVHRVADAFSSAFGADLCWRRASGRHPPEATTLTLSSALALKVLGWRPRLSFDETLAWTADWYRAHRDGADMRAVSLAQIAAYEDLAT